MIEFRLAPLSAVDLTVEVAKRRLFVLWKYWVKFSTVRSRVNKKEHEIIETIDKLKKQLSERKLLVEQYLSEMDEAQDRARYNYGLSDPLKLDEKAFNERIGPYCDRPDDDWIEFFNPKVIREYGLKINRKRGDFEMSYSGAPTQNGRRAGQQPLTPGPSGHSTAYTFPEYADRSLHIGEQTDVDQIVGFREDKQQRQGGDQKARMKELRQENRKHQGESEQDYNNRLQEIYRDETRKD